MKIKLFILSLLFCLNSFGQVPNNETFNLQNVVDVVNPTTNDLVDCFADADNNKFDPLYVGDKTNLLNFRNYGAVHYNDWFLPSKDELIEIRDELYLFGVGGLTAAFYWSSSEYNDTLVNVVNFNTGAINQFPKGNMAIYTRACRSFVAGVGTYSLRDTGPAGGLIFYIDGAGTTYYEAAPSDQSISYVWSNIIDTAVTGTGTAIGTGLNNTDLIIAQPGHVDSAAKLCNDL